MGVNNLQCPPSYKPCPAKGKRVKGKIYLNKFGNVRKWDGKYFRRVKEHPDKPFTLVPEEQRDHGEVYLNHHGVKRRWDKKRRAFRPLIEKKAKPRTRARYNLLVRHGLSEEQYIELFEKFKYKCRYCEKALKPFTPDACVNKRVVFPEEGSHNICCRNCFLSMHMWDYHKTCN